MVFCTARLGQAQRSPQEDAMDFLVGQGHATDGAVLDPLQVLPATRGIHASPVTLAGRRCYDEGLDPVGV